jgi:glycosyltransferase involved in cell wall biosynthesis
MENADIQVSVVLPFYNGGKTLEKTIESIITQTFDAFEIIIVDDGSPEPLEHAIGPYKEHPKIRIIKQENGGVAAARNKGIDNARGEFIAFCDQDDIWLPTKLERQIPLFNNENVGLVYTWTNAIDAQGNETTISPKHEGNCFYPLILKNFITCCTVVARKSLLASIGFFRADRALQGVDDRYVWMRLSRVSEFKVVKEPLAKYVTHGENYSLNNHKMLSADIYCFTVINELDDLSREELDWCRKGLDETYLHYANNFLYRNDLKEAASCYRAYWQRNKSQLAYGLLSVLFHITPPKLIIFMKKFRKTVLNKMGNN